MNYILKELLLDKHLEAAGNPSEYLIMFRVNTSFLTPTVNY